MTTFSVSTAEADETLTSEEARAAAHFDRAIEHFRAADFEAATRAFLLADQIAPDGDTLSNALNSAKRSGSHLLVALVSERAIEVHHEDKALSRLARSALAVALPHLGRLRLSCAPAPCEVFVDDEPATDRNHLVDPGTHRVQARFGGTDEHREIEQVVQVAAGTSYVFRLEPEDQETPSLRRHRRDPYGRLALRSIRIRTSGPPMETRSSSSPGCRPRRF